MVQGIIIGATLGLKGDLSVVAKRKLNDSNQEVYIHLMFVSVIT